MQHPHRFRGRGPWRRYAGTPVPAWGDTQALQTSFLVDASKGPAQVVQGEHLPVTVVKEGHLRLLGPHDCKSLADHLGGELRHGDPPGRRASFGVVLAIAPGLLAFDHGALDVGDHPLLGLADVDRAQGEHLSRSQTSRTVPSGLDPITPGPVRHTVAAARIRCTCSKLSAWTTFCGLVSSDVPSNGFRWIASWRRANAKSMLSSVLECLARE